MAGSCLAKSTAAALVASILVATPSAQMPKPTFEAASVKKRTEPLFSPGQSQSFGGVFIRQSTTLEALILYAYDIRDYQLIGGPDWVARTPTLFEVAATAGRDVPAAELRLMVQSLLEERFRLITHKEQREMPVYALALARSDGRLGPNLHRKQDDDCTKTRPAPPRPAGAARAVGCGPITGMVSMVSNIMGAPVIDKTRLSGRLEYVLYYSPSLLSSDGDLPAFPVALQEQLGLRLEATRGPVEMLVIDSVQQPTPN